MKLLVDMNLSPVWVTALREEGWEAVHWSEVGDPRAPDDVILGYARDLGWTVFTNDLDFGALLAHVRTGKPSVFQLRAQALTPGALGLLVFDTLRRFAGELDRGALITVDERRQRVRLLPLD